MVKKKQKVKRENKILFPEISEPKINIGDYSLLFYGAKKIGKTTLASKFPDTVFIMTEPGGESLRIRQIYVNNWEDFRDALDVVYENKRKFKTLVIDTPDPLYDMCFQYMCKKVLYIEHPNDEKDYGKSWKEINTEFLKHCGRLLPKVSNRGLILLSHATFKPITIVDTEIERVVPTMERHAMEFFDAKVDLMGYYQYRKKDRKLLIHGNENVEAGCRLQENKEFFITTSGERIEEIYLGNSSKEAFNNFMRAFNNKQIRKGGDYESEEHTNIVKKKKKKKF